MLQKGRPSTILGIMAALVVGSVLLLAARPAQAVRCVENSAWTEAKGIKATFESSSKPRPEERQELSRRWDPLAAEQRALLDQACRHDAEEQALVQERNGIEARKAQFDGQCRNITTQSQVSACQALANNINGAVASYNPKAENFRGRDSEYGNRVRAWVARVQEVKSFMQTALARDDSLLREAQALAAQSAQLLTRATAAAQETQRLKAILSTLGGSQ